MCTNSYAPVKTGPNALITGGHGQYLCTGTTYLVLAGGKGK